MITNEIVDFLNLDFQTGEIILVDKPFKWSSFKVIHEIRKVIGTRKVGHAGTLDPMATGLLILATGKKTKAHAKNPTVKLFTTSVRLSRWVTV